MRKIIIISSLLLGFVTAVAQTKVRMDLNIMTFNIRYDNPDDGLNNWKFRKENVIKVIRFQEIDVLGAQEVLSNQLKEMNAQLQE